MQKQATYGIASNPIAESAINASRQMWLAGLGAAAVTRDWARTEAGKTFRTLVKEGSAVETKAIRDVSKRVENSVATATSLWKQTRATAVTAANTFAQNASAALSKFKAPVMVRSAPAKARKIVKATKKSAQRTTRRVKRATRKA
jgi:hypothetical protein